MKSILTILLFFSVLFSFSQSKEQRKLLGQTVSLKYAAFTMKKCNIFKDLIADTLSFTDLKGNKLNKEKAIDFFCNNQSVFTETEISPYNATVEDNKDKSIFQLKGQEKNEDGSINEINFIVRANWIKVKRKWKMIELNIENQ